MKYFYPGFNLDLFMMTYSTFCGAEKGIYLLRLSLEYFANTLDFSLLGFIYFVFILV